jgi:hypothetical protein
MGRTNLGDIANNRSLSSQLMFGLYTALARSLSQISNLSAKLLRIEGLKYSMACSVPGIRVALFEIR